MKVLTIISWSKVLSISLIISVIFYATHDSYDVKTMTFQPPSFVLTNESLQRSLPISHRYNQQPLTEALTAEIAIVHHAPAIAIEQYIELSKTLNDVTPLKKGFSQVQSLKNPYYQLKLALTWLSIEPNNQTIFRFAAKLLRQKPQLAFLILEYGSTQATATQLLKILINDGLTQQAHALQLQIDKKFFQNDGPKKISKHSFFNSKHDV